MLRGIGNVRRGPCIAEWIRIEMLDAIARKVIALHLEGSGELGEHELAALDGGTEDALRADDHLVAPLWVDGEDLLSGPSLVASWPGATERAFIVHELEVAEGDPDCLVLHFGVEDGVHEMRHHGRVDAHVLRPGEDELLLLPVRGVIRSPPGPFRRRGARRVVDDATPEGLPLRIHGGLALVVPGHEAQHECGTETMLLCRLVRLLGAEALVVEHDGLADEMILLVDGQWVVRDDGSPLIRGGIRDGTCCGGGGRG